MIYWLFLDFLSFREVKIIPDCWTAGTAEPSFKLSLKSFKRRLKFNFSSKLILVSDKKTQRFIIFTLQSVIGA